MGCIYRVILLVKKDGAYLINDILLQKYNFIILAPRRAMEYKLENMHAKHYAPHHISSPKWEYYIDGNHSEVNKSTT